MNSQAIRSVVCHECPDEDNDTRRGWPAVSKRRVRTSQVHTRKEPTCQCRRWVWSLGWEDPLEKEMATHSNTLAWEIPWTEEPGGLQAMRWHGVGHFLATKRWVRTQTSFPDSFILKPLPVAPGGSLQHPLQPSGPLTFCLWDWTCCLFSPKPLVPGSSALHRGSLATPSRGVPPLLHPVTLTPACLTFFYCLDSPLSLQWTFMWKFSSYLPPSVECKTHKGPAWPSSVPGVP